MKWQAFEFVKIINVDEIHSEVYREVENAYFTTDPYAVFADVTGIDFDVDKMKELIDSDPSAEEYAIKLDYTEADVTVQDLGKEAFPDLLGSFSTKYVTSNADRTTNLRLAANKINDTVIMPGEIFSYNKTVGKGLSQLDIKPQPFIKMEKLQMDLVEEFAKFQQLYIMQL